MVNGTDYDKGVQDGGVLQELKDLKLRMEAESKRLDALRAVDTEAVRVANDRAIAAASSLASQVATTAETLRSLVASTATSVAQQLSQISAQFNERLTTLEQKSYEQRGGSTGMKDLWGWAVSGVLCLVGLLTFLIP